MIWLGQLNTAGVLSIMSSNLAKSSPYIYHGRVKSQQFGAKPLWIKVVMAIHFLLQKQNHIMTVPTFRVFPILSCK